MKQYKSKDLVYRHTGVSIDCNILGFSDGLPFKAARVETSKVLPDERLHCHPKGYELYWVIKGALILRVGDKVIKLEDRVNDMAVVEPGEPHRVLQVLQILGNDVDYIVFNTNADPNDKIYLE